MADKLLTIKQASERLGFAPGSIYNRICKNAKRPFPVKPFRVGGAVRFRESDIEKFIQGGTDEQ